MPTQLSPAELKAIFPNVDSRKSLYIARKLANICHAVYLRCVHREIQGQSQTGLLLDRLHGRGVQDPVNWRCKPALWSDDAAGNEAVRTMRHSLQWTRSEDDSVLLAGMRLGGDARHQEAEQESKASPKSATEGTPGAVRVRRVEGAEFGPVQVLYARGAQGLHLRSLQRSVLQKSGKSENMFSGVSFGSPVSAAARQRIPLMEGRKDQRRYDTSQQFRVQAMARGGVSSRRLHMRRLRGARRATNRASYQAFRQESTPPALRAERHNDLLAVSRETSTKGASV